MQDIRYALRALWRDRGFTTTAILILGIGIGSNTAIFSIVNTLLFRPPQVRAAERLVFISNVGGDGGLSSQTSRVANYLDWKAGTKTMEDMAAYFAFFDYGTYSMIGSGEPERLVGVDVSQNFLDFLGVQPVLGRWFNEQESKWNGTPAVVLTNGLWKRRFAGDPKIVGRNITLNNKSRHVVGVLPASFDFSTMFTPGSRVDILVPFPLTSETDRWGNTLAVLGRLRPGTTVAQAQAEFTVMSEQIRQEKKGRWKFGAKVTPLTEHLTGRFRRGLFILLAAVGMVLLVGCANLSSLMLSRAASRRREMAIRSALGAGRGRLVRQMLVESLIIAVPGAVFGLALAWLGIRGLAVVHGVNIPLLQTVKIDGSALLFTMLATVLTALLFGLVPALETSGRRDANALKEGGRSGSEGRRSGFTRNALVISEVALACVLLVGAGLLMRSFVQVLDVKPGFEPEQAAAWRIDTAGHYDQNASRQLYERLATAIEAVPGVESAGVTDALPLSRDRSWGLGVKGRQYRDGEMPLGHPRIVDWRYLKAMRIPLIAGREFTAQDDQTKPAVVMINQKAAGQLFGNGDPIGQMLTVGGRDGSRVIGVVGNVRHESVEEEGGLEMYLPITQNPMPSVELVVRTRVPIASVAPAIRRALREVDSNLPTVEYRELTDLIARAVSPRRFMVLLLAGFAVTALLLASIGIYGVMSYTVGRRTQEIGLRMALGASTFRVQKEIMARVVGLVSGGIGAGILGSVVVARLMASMLFKLEPTDPATLVGTVAVLLGVAMAAAYLPARRASRVDPMKALRTE
ncbi:MAG: hypothetical protein JWN34_3558 [Bryobacterales bacterium]|nr:hypothetical protein [Bryobacterales bacterium]